MVRTYAIYPENQYYWGHPIGTVDAESAKVAIKKAKILFPRIGAPVVFNREDYKEVKHKEYLLMKAEKQAMIAARELEVA